MVFTRRFYILLALGILPLLLFWSWRWTKWLMLLYDIALILLAWLDWRRAADVAGVEVKRLLTRRFMIGTENDVQLSVINRAPRKVTFTIRDEYPPELELRGARTLTATPKRTAVIIGYRLFAAARGDYHFGDVVLRWSAPRGLAIRQLRVPAAATVKVYPNINEARKHELFAIKNRLLQAGQRRINFKGQGREFESLRDYVRGDELRHVSWAATARRGKLVTRQYQIERNQSIVVMLDAGRLMTSRIEHLSKLDHAINAALSIGYVAVSGGDNIGLLTFTRQVTAWLPPQRGHAQMNAIIEALYNVKPLMTEPSYARAFQYFQQNCKRRSLVIILTDLVDRDASAELLAHTATLLPRHLPLIVTIGDKDLRALVAQTPRSVSEVWQQSVAEELLQQREEALARITELGGLALDVPAGQLAFELVNKYLEVKERGLL
ncbi:MAG TPA: DUF58 domain-containing protein [Blastocatellia bacterium]|nr:DUF58 domain-containing protein [Blastocatellia bacterium]